MLQEIIQYGIDKNLITERDRDYIANQLADILQVPVDSDKIAEATIDNIDDLLYPLLQEAHKKGMIESLHPDFADLLDSHIMGVFCDKPSAIQNHFDHLYATSPKQATDWFYQYNIDVNYIRMNRINKNIQWKHSSPYGDLEITINLSKPEKDPLAIAAQKNNQSTNYPLCVLCKENEGFFGHISHPARQNLRLISLTLNDKPWYFQYSPYIYYNHHSIVLSEQHENMLINKDTFKNLCAFLDLFPHYFIGSNADLPIVGGSILSHNHYQAGAHIFPINHAKILKSYHSKDEGIKFSLLKWPLNVIRLSSKNSGLIIKSAVSLSNFWENYNNAPLNIFSHTGGVRHNTITPIARKNGDYYELDLTLRNNFTTSEHPLGLYHPHQEYHHIKKENIGLIEVMGLAILPGRLENEIKLMEEYLLKGTSAPELDTHLPWLDLLKTQNTITAENIQSILREEIGKVFSKVLEDCGVFKSFEDFDLFFQEWKEG